MMKSIIFTAMLIMAVSGVFAQETVLPNPANKAGVDLMTAIENRRVAKSFTKKEVSASDLSTILWAALGKRSADAVTSATQAGRNISFSGGNAYINLYVLTSKGVWKYLPEKNSLLALGGADARSTVSRAAVPDAALMLLFTVDNALTPSFLKGNPDLFKSMAHATAGFSAQNASLVASALKMAAVVQYTMDAQAASTVARLGKDEAPLFILQAGYTE